MACFDSSVHCVVSRAWHPRTSRAFAAGLALCASLPSTTSAGPSSEKVYQAPPAEFRRVLPEESGPGPRRARARRGSPTAVGGPSVTVKHIEVTQGVQNPKHDVPILADRGAWVRIFLDIDGAAGNAATAKVSGELSIALTGGETRTVASSERFQSTIDRSENGNLAKQRSNVSSGLVFQLPADLVRKGTWEVTLSQITNNNLDRQMPCSNCGNISRKITTSDGAPPFRVAAIGITFNYKGKTYEPRPYDFDSLRSWLVRAFPVSEIIYDWRVVPYPDPDSHPPIDAQGATEFDCRDVNALLSQLRAADMNGGADPRTHYIGLVYDGDKPDPFPWLRGCATVPSTPNPKATAASPAGRQKHFDWDKSGSYTGWYGGHELAHTLGRSHVGGSCREGAVAPYPYPDGDLSNAADDYVIFDPGDVIEGTTLGAVAIPGYPNGSGRNAHDIMSYCDFVWTSAYSLKFLHERLAAEDAMQLDMIAGAGSTGDVGGAAPMSSGPGPAASEPNAALLNIVARVEGGWQQGSIDAITAVSKADEGPQAVGDSPVVEMMGSSGQVIATYPAAVSKFTQEDATTSEADRKPAGLINITVLTQPGVTGVRLVYSGKVLAERTAAAAQSLRASPRVEAGPRRGGARLARRAGAERPVELSWEGQEQTGKSFTYTVQLSSDGGASWRTIAVNLKTTKMDINSKHLPSRSRSAYTEGRPIKYKVIASDGFTSTEIIGDLPQ